MNPKKSTLLVLAAIIGFFSASAQDETKYGATPEIQQQCKENISLYREFRNQKDYASAYGPWQKVLQLCPKAALTIYTDGAKFLKDRIKDNKDAAQEAVLIDSLMMIYDMRIENFGDRGGVLGYKGIDLLYTAKDPIAAYNTLKESVSIDKSKSIAPVIDIYYRAMFEALKVDSVTKSEILEEYLVLSDYVGTAIKTASEKEKEGYLKVKSNLDEIFVLIATCEDIEVIAAKRFEEAPNDLDNIKKTMRILAKRECTNGDIFTKVAGKLNELDPSYESAYALSISMLKKSDYSEALKFIKQALELGDSEIDELTKADYYLIAASAAIGSGQASTAASYARKAYALDNNNGKALLIIGDAIASSAPSCGDNEVTKKFGYWLAVDYYQRARSKDAKVADIANSKISAYTKRFPDKKLLFQYGYMDASGSVKKEPVKIGCWINESVVPRLVE